MANLNLKSTDNMTFDAIVVGSGISGGWAAKELTEKGLKTLVLDRGRDVKHVEDYPTMFKDNWDLPHRNKVPEKELAEHYPQQRRTGYTVTQQGHKHFFVKDSEHPYYEKQRFDWIRGWQVGGKSLVWGRQSYRWSDLDFEANAKEGIATDWPIRYKDLAPWYTHVEKHVGISGEALNLPHLPDSVFQPPMNLNCVEEHLKNSIRTSYPERHLTIGRTAHVTKGLEHQPSRGKCQFRNRCMRGCPYGAYFSSQSSTLPMAEATGNLTLRPNSIVSEVIYDPETKKATGVKVMDKETKEEFIFKAKVIFLCASALASTWVLMNSKSDRYENGLGNDSDQLGRNIMDHHFHVGAVGEFEQFNDQYYKGRRPNGIYVPRFRNISNSTKMDFTRGYGYQGGAGRGKDWQNSVAEMKYGGEMKDSLYGVSDGWNMNLLGFGECLPYEENRMELNHDKPDQWGMPTITFDASFKENEKKMRIDMADSAAEMLENAGAKNIKKYNKEFEGIGLGIHEMGTARMGTSVKNSILNKHNQIHEVSNVYVTDGAAMTSSSCVNPSLTYMALTARAANHAVEELKKMNL